MKVYCVHFLWAKDGKIVDMPPRTVSKLEDAGVIITLNGEPSGEQIFMNWEPDTKNHCWVGESEIAWNIKAMAHEIDGVPDVQRDHCDQMLEAQP